MTIPKHETRRTETTKTSFTVVPYRFSANVPAMADFLRALGLQKVVSTDGDGFGIFRGRSGMVAVHSVGDTATGAQPGETQLSFETADAAAAEARLSQAGLDATTWDESYGRHAGVQDPQGGGIWINEEMQDYHGYRHYQVTEPPVPIDVVAVYFTADFATDGEFFGHLGFQPDSHGDEFWQPLRAGRDRGVIGLHHLDGEPARGADSPDSPVGPATLVHLGFETSEDLQTVADRLRAAGYSDAAVVTADGLSAVHVTDPDGQALEIHASTAE